jgi:hypothetical protein
MYTTTYNEAATTRRSRGRYTRSYIQSLAYTPIEELYTLKLPTIQMKLYPLSRSTWGILLFISLISSSINIIFLFIWSPPFVMWKVPLLLLSLVPLLVPLWTIIYTFTHHLLIKFFILIVLFVIVFVLLLIVLFVFKIFIYILYILPFLLVVIVVYEIIYKCVKNQLQNN